MADSQLVGGTKNTKPTGMNPGQVEEAQKAGTVLERMLSFRRCYDQRRSGYYRQYIGQQDRRNFPDNVTPRSNTFYMAPFSNVEAIVSRVADAFFNFDPWFECKGRNRQDEPAADAMDQVLAYKLDKARLIPAFEEFTRNVLIYGHSGLKVDWDWGFDVGVEPNPDYAMMPDPTGSGQMIPIPGPDGKPIVVRYNPQTKQVPRMCPKFTAIDVYDLLVDPDGGFVAHLADKTWGGIQAEQAMSLQMAQLDPTHTLQAKYLPEGFAELERRIGSEPDASSVIVRVAELWNEIDGTVTMVTTGLDKEALSWKDLRAAYRQASYTAYRRKMFGGSPVLLYSGPNPFAHKKAPILTANYIKVPGEMYGLGAIEIISDMTESMNRFVNMIADNWNLGINRRYAYNTDADIDHAALNSFNVPGGKVGVVGNPNEVIMPLPFFTPQRGDYAVLDVYKSMIETTSGVSDFYDKGVGSPTNNKTASGIAGVINETNLRFKMFIRNLEIEVLQPLLAMCASMIQQYTTDEEEVRITRAAPGVDKWPRVTPEQLIGNFDFELVAANYATNKVVRQRNLLAFANWGMQTPYWNAAGALEEFAKVFEVRNYYKLIKPEQQVQMEQQQQLASQAHMMLLQHLLEAESKMLVAEAGRKPGPEGGVDQATQHALQVQKFIEDFLQNSGNIPVEKMTPPPPGAMNSKGKVGKPRNPSQPEGAIPGAGNQSAGREVGQSLGANGMGLGGNHSTS